MDNWNQQIVCFWYCVLQKADKKSLEAKVNTKLFDKTTEEINNMIKEILDKLAGHVSWIYKYFDIGEIAMEETLVNIYGQW